MSKFISTIFFCYVFLLFTCSVSGQTPTPIALEKVTPPTPEAASLGKVADFPVGLYTGTPNVNIELYKLKVKELEIPISLSYSTNGVKVDEMPTKTGMSWVLNAGGVITRTVYDKADDAYTRASFPYTDDQIASTSGTDMNIPAWLELIDAHNLDTQFDEYSFNFNGYSGKFIIDLNNNPVLIPYSNLKIELNPFKITTPDGIQYYFTAGENSSYSASGGCSRDNAHPYTSAWYLTKIVNPNDPSDYIDISYIAGGYFYHPQINQTITYYDQTNICGTGAQGQYNDPCGCQTPCIYGTKGSPNLTVDNFCTNTEGVTIPYLSEIKSSLYGKIKFIYNTSYHTSITPIPNDRLLTSIQIYQNNDGTNLLKSFNLNYTFAKPQTSGKITSTDNIATENPDINSYRPFLSSLQELDNSNTVIKTHTFDYNDINSLTARLSSSQDFWGYFNGKSNPTSLIPASSNVVLPAIKIADRSPDYNYAVKGMLQKVTFPTGGYTSFVYEGNTKRTGPPPPPPPAYLPVSSVQATNITHSVTFYIFQTTTINIDRYIYCCSQGTNTCKIADNGFIWGQVNTVLNGVSTTISSYSFAEYNQRGECSFGRTETLTLQPGTYGLYVSGFDKYQLSLTATSSGGGQIWVLDPNHTIANMAVLATDGGGVRVKQKTSYDPFSQTGTTVNYTYNGMIIPFTPNYINNISYRQEIHSWIFTPQPDCPITVVPCAELQTCTYSQYSSNSSVNTYGRGGSLVYYTSVTETNNDGGGIEHTYTWYSDADLHILRGNLIPNSSAPASAWKNGLELTQTIFKTVNGSKVYLKKIMNTYTDDSRINNVYGQYITKRSGMSSSITDLSSNCTANHTFNLRMNVFDVVSYATTQKWTYLSSKQETDYDMDGLNPIATTTNYFYDNLNSTIPTRIETTDSRNKIVKKVNKFPGDEATITNLNITESDAITKLKAQNNFSPALESERYVSDILQSRIHIGYKDWGNNILKPQTIKNQIQANPIESRLEYTQYDVNGNLLSQKKTDDFLNSYIWDYKSSYPIAEVRNAPQANIAYTSFEADGTGGWTTLSSDGISPLAGFTGTNCYPLSSTNTLKKTGLASGNYIVTYWQKNSEPGTAKVNGSTGTIVTAKKGWTLYTQTVKSTTSVTITGTAVIDEVRLYPVSAQMTTYTYAPLIGMTSQCDAANHVITYEYDGLGRLSLIRDQDNNIIKKMDYHFTGQAASSAPACTCTNLTIGEKCIGTQCRQGMRVNTSTIKQSNGKWQCNYNWEWYDGSPYSMTEYNDNPCFTN